MEAPHSLLHQLNISDASIYYFYISTAQAVTSMTILIFLIALKKKSLLKFGKI